MRNRGDSAADNIGVPFRGSVAVAEEVFTPKQLRSPLFVNLFRDVFLRAGIPITHELRCQAAALVAPKNAVLTGHSAACHYGLALAVPSDPVEFVIPEDEQFRPYPGMNIRHVPILRDEYELVPGMRLATPWRMTLDLLLNSRLRKTLAAAVGALDAVLHQGLIDLDTLRARLNERHDHGIVRARRVVAMADARAESVPESALRVLLGHARIPVTPQVEVHHLGEFVGRVDLAVDGYRIAVEYDGEWHADPEQSRLDAARRTRLTKAGWHVIVVRKDDLYQRPEEIVRAVQRAFSAENALLADAG